MVFPKSNGHCGGPITGDCLLRPHHERLTFSFLYRKRVRRERVLGRRGRRPELEGSQRRGAGVRYVFPNPNPASTFAHTRLTLSFIYSRRGNESASFVGAAIRGNRQEVTKARVPGTRRTVQARGFWCPRDDPSRFVCEETRPCCPAIARVVRFTRHRPRRRQVEHGLCLKERQRVWREEVRVGPFPNPDTLFISQLVTVQTDYGDCSDRLP